LNTGVSFALRDHQMRNRFSDSARSCRRADRASARRSRTRVLVGALVLAAGLLAAAIAQAATTGAKLTVTGAVHGSYRIGGYAAGGSACQAGHFNKQEGVSLSFAKNFTSLIIISTPGHQPTGKIDLATTKDWTVLFATEEGGGVVGWQSGDGLGAGREGTGTLSLAKGYDSGHPSRGRCQVRCRLPQALRARCRSRPAGTAVSGSAAAVRRSRRCRSRQTPGTPIPTAPARRSPGRSRSTPSIVPGAPAAA